MAIPEVSVPACCKQAHLDFEARHLRNRAQAHLQQRSSVYRVILHTMPTWNQKLFQNATHVVKVQKMESMLGTKKREFRYHGFPGKRTRGFSIDAIIDQVSWLADDVNQNV